LRIVNTFLINELRVHEKYIFAYMSSIFKALKIYKMLGRIFSE